MARTRVGLHGATGRMGRAISALTASSDYSETAVIAAEVGSSGEPAALEQCDVVIDVSLPAGTAALVTWLENRSGKRPALVSGTTGLDADLVARMMALGETGRVLYAPNFSAGVAALHEIVAFSNRMLSALGYTPVLTETHHQHKLDAPSGTARSLQAVLAPDDPESIETHSIRTGEVIGRHELRFRGADDEITFVHDAKDRRLFARGALEAALWLAAETQPGAYTMQSYFRKRFLGDDS